MCGVKLKTIREWRNKGVSQINVISAQVQTAGGMQGVSLFDEDAIFEAFNEYNPSLLIQCAKIGLRMYLHGLAGSNSAMCEVSVFRWFDVCGVEFFVLPSGEAGMSMSGLASLCGVSKQALSKMLQVVSTKDFPEFLKLLQGVDLIPSTNNVIPCKSRGANLGFLVI